MFTSWRLGRMFGFPVEINLSFLVLLAVAYFAFGGLAGLFVIALLFGSVVLHELGHALVARRLGVHVSGIELSFFGGAAKMVQMPRSADHEIAIAAAGPAVSLLLAGAGFGLGFATHVELFSWIGKINAILAAFNLIPALPMDGGRILRALLTRRMDFVRATDVAVDVARVAAIAFAIIGLATSWFMLVVLAPLLWMMGTRERMLARAMADDYAGFGRRGVDVTPRGGGPFDPPSFFDRRPGPYGRGPSGGPAIRRFTIRQVGGRMVIESLD
jgi:Zn-dependent protease